MWRRTAEVTGWFQPVSGVMSNLNVGVAGKYARLVGSSARGAICT